MTDPSDTPELPDVERASTDDVLEGAPSKEDVVQDAPSVDDVIAEQPSVDEILGKER